MSSVTVQGEQVHYVHRAAATEGAPPVAFIHGAGGTHQSWLYQVRDLPGVESYAVDLPGHGRSEGPGRESVAAYGEWLVDLLDALELQRAVLVGHSMGGAIALDVALAHAARASGLGLVASGARLRVVPAVLDGLRQDPEAAVDLICRSTYGPEAPVEMVGLGRRQMGEVEPAVILGDLLACDRFDVAGRLGEIAVPCAVVCGTQDGLTPTKYATYLRDRIQGATLHLVEGAGHMVMLENPGAVAQAIGALVERIDPR